MYGGGPVVLQGVPDLSLGGPGPFHPAVVAKIHQQVEGWGGGGGDPQRCDLAWCRPLFQYRYLSVGSGVVDLVLNMAILIWVDTSFTRMGKGRDADVEAEEDADEFLVGRRKASDMVFWNWGRVGMIFWSLVDEYGADDSVVDYR